MDKLKFNNTFCPLLFVQQYINTKKEMAVCCFSNKIISSDLDFNSNDYKDIRNTMLNGSWSDHCQNCQKLEEQKLISPRQKAVKDIYLSHKDIVDEQVQNHTNGLSVHPHFYDLRISNLCNLTCQMCDAEHSSSIAKLKKTPTEFLSYEPSIDINPNTFKLYLAGGEPFLIKKFIQFLDSITNLDCEIVVNTNGTIINEKLLTALQRFKNVNITLSLDGYKELNDKIRRGSNWDTIVKNMQIFIERGFSIHVNTVLQKDNVNELLALGEFLDNKVSKWTLSELIEPYEMQWIHADIDKNQISPLMELKLVKMNIASVYLLNKILT